MPKLIAALIILAAVLVIGYLRAAPSSPAEDFDKLPAPERVARARATRTKIIYAEFRRAGLSYPPREIFLRWFKKEALIELWARSHREPFRLINGYPILANSGGPGPKRRQGDRQVPEGFYEIDRFNPESVFHLSLGLNYPNASDRVLSDHEKPGGDIFIHGNKVSIGCGPIGDAAIEALYVIALDAKNGGQSAIPVHIFPARMSGPDWPEFMAAATAENPALRHFWDQLQPAYDFFERHHRVPKMAIAKDGSYRLISG